MSGNAREPTQKSDAADRNTWKSLAAKAVGDTEISRALARTTADGLTRGPLHMAADTPSLAASRAIKEPVWSLGCPWDIRQELRAPSPASANAEALDDLMGGVSSLEIAVDPDGRHGIMIRGVDDLDKVLEDVRLEIAPIAFDAGPWGLQIAAMLASIWRERGVPAEQARAAFNLDPLGRLARGGPLSRDLDVEMADAAAWAFWSADSHPMATTFRADGRTVHEAGGSEAWEIGFTAATAFAYLDLMVEYDLPLDLAARHILLACAVDADVHLGIAKLRALRRVWRRVLSAACVTDPRFTIQAFGSRRMLTRRDPWTNLIRLTTAGFAAATGGADVISLPAFTDPLGPPNAFARRVSRNIHILLQEESHLGAVADPAGGSYHHDVLSDALAQKGWACFQEIQVSGGAERFIVDGRLAERVAATRSKLEGDVRRRRSSIVGVSEFAALEEKAVGTATPDLAGLRAEADARSAARPKPEARVFRLAPDLLIPLAASGADISSMTPPEPESPEPHFETPLPEFRLAEPFEALRDAAESYAERHGRSPTAFLATLGDEKDFAARATWTKNLFAAGGIALAGGASYADIEELAAALAADRSSVAVLCGADSIYADLAVTAAQRLADTGSAVWLVGKPGELEEPLRAAGVTRFLHVGVDVADALTEALKLLEAGDA